jgi:hypothetical protein
MKLTGGRLMTGGALVRLTYGLGAMFAPRFIAGRYAAAEPGSMMNLRGFGGQHIAVGPIALGGVLLPFVGLTTGLTALLTVDR